MKKLFFFIPALLLSLLASATGPTITIDGNKSDWAEVPMLSEPGVWPMLKVIPAADAELGTNALAYMMENTTDFDNTWAQYPTEFIDSDYDKATNTIDEYWAFSAMGIEYKATTGIDAGGWISFPKAISSDNKVIEIGLPATYITELGSKFGFAMYYNSGAWFCPDRSTPAQYSFSPANGFLYKTRSFTTVTGTTTLTTANVFAHPSMGEVGEYVDFGLRDNGYDTLRWAAFPIELTQPAVYDVTTNITSTNSYKFEFWLVDVASNAIVAHLPTPKSNISSSNTTYTFGSLDLRNVPAGKYMLKVMNKTAYSTVKLNSIQLTYNGGNLVDIPGTLDIADAVITGGKRQEGAIKFDDATTGTAEWKIAVTTATYMEVTATIKNLYGHNISISVFEEDGVTPVGNVSEGSNTYTSNETGLVINLGKIYLQAGTYIAKYSNATDGSDAKLVDIGFAYIGGAVQNMPGTTAIADAWFSAEGTRADGKIDFPNGTIQDGWVKWNVAFASAANYNVIVNIANDNGHNYTVALYEDEDDESPIVLSEGSQKSTIGTLEMGSMEVPAGNYILKVANAVQWSDAQLISVQFVYAGGGTIDIPGSIALSEAILSTRAYMDGDDLHFTDADHLGTISGEYAKWNINVAADGIFTFTANCNASNHSHMKISVMDEDENVLFTHQTQWSFNTATSVVTPEWFLEAGNYILKAENPADWSDGYLTSLSAAQVANILIVDENATDMAYINEKNGQSMKPLLKRSFRSGMFNTVCFPFNGVTAGELESIFGAGYELLEMSSATLADNVLTLNFSPVDLSGSTYGRPYLIKPTQDVVNPLFNSHTIYKSTSHLVTAGDNANFIGSFIKGTVPAGEDNLFLGANDLLYFSETATTIKGMRAYFLIHDVPSGAPIRQARIVEQGNVVTALEFVNGEWQEVKSANGTIKTIENGQLILIRDGKRYNVMGVRF